MSKRALQPIFRPSLVRCATSVFYTLLFFCPLANSLTTSLQWRATSHDFHQRYHRPAGEKRIQRTNHHKQQTNNNSYLSMHMGHSHSHSHDRHPLQSQSPPSQKRRVQLSVTTACIALLLSSPLSTHLYHAALLGLGSGVAAYASIPPVVQRLGAWIKGITRHRPRYAPQQNAADRVTVLGGIVNLFLSAAKLSVGILCHSSALIADAGHSLSDLFSDVVTLWAVSVGRLPPDEDHPYGHGKFEAVGSLFLSLTLLGTGLGIGLLSNQKLLEILSLQRKGLTAIAAPLPGLPALCVAAISVGVKEWLFRITKRVGERLQSNVVIANAWHHRSDAYSSILAVASIGLARYVPGLVFCDAAAGLLVGATIGMTGAEILGDSINLLTDRHPEALGQAVAAAARDHPAVTTVSDVKARPVGSVVAVDVQVVSDANEKDIQQHIEQSLQEHQTTATASSASASATPAVTHHHHHTTTTTQVRVHTDAMHRLVQRQLPAGVAIQTVARRPDGEVDVVLRGAVSQSVARRIQASLEAREDVDAAHVYLDLTTTTTKNVTV